MKRVLFLSLAILMAGCATSRQRRTQAPNTMPPAPAPDAQVGGPLPPPAAPYGAVQAFPTVPPTQAFPANPPTQQTMPLPAPPTTMSPPPLPGGGVPPVASNTRVEAQWQPVEARVLLAPPEPISEQNKMYPPEAVAPKTTAEPPLNGPKSTTSLPVGIRQFAIVRPNVAAGLKPSADDGIDWLQTNRYRVALQLHAVEEDISSDLKQIEQHGMQYRHLTISPRGLTPQVVEEFNRIVSDPANEPLFVYDRDGTLAGAMWYLHFRTAGRETDEVARIRAGALGLRETQENQREMWLAVQKYLSERE